MGKTQINEKEILMNNKEKKAVQKLFKIAEGQPRKKDDPQTIKKVTLMCNQAGYEVTQSEVKDCIEILNRAIDLLNEDKALAPWEQDANWWRGDN